MLILSQDGKKIVNLNNVYSVDIASDKNEIMCSYPFGDDGDSKKLCWNSIGKYSSVDRAKAVLCELYDTLAGGYGTFKMPRDDGEPKECENCERRECPYDKIGKQYRPFNCRFYFV